MMGTGILVCGLNGCGKSTLGRALAQRLGYHFIDIEDLYFPKTNPDYLYDGPRPRAEAEALLLDEIHDHGHFVLAAVKGDFGRGIPAFFQCALLLQVPRDIRMERVRNRSFQKFGDRMLPGGDLYGREEQFFRMAASRSERDVEGWLGTLRCPVFPVDGTRPIEENITLIIKGLDAMKQEKSCGAVIFREENTQRKYLILKSTLGHTTLCKGHVEGNETEHETATREIREETGLTVEFIDGFRDVIAYSPRPGVMKDVVFFLARAQSICITCQPEEVAEAAFVSLDEALEKLTHGSDRDTLQKAHAFLEGR